jgi:tRNA dimethylallyltransferase
MGTPTNPELRAELETLSNEELYAQVCERDPHRASELDPKNKRRLIRALEIIEVLGTVPKRPEISTPFSTRFNLVENGVAGTAYEVEWVVINPPAEELRMRLDARLKSALERGLIDEVKTIRERVGDTRLNELGLEYRIVGEFLRGERDEASLLPALSSKLWQYVRRQKNWLRKLATTNH